MGANYLKHQLGFGGHGHSQGFGQGFGQGDFGGFGNSYYPNQGYNKYGGYY